jgi:hypothetical protein
MYSAHNRPHKLQAAQRPQESTCRFSPSACPLTTWPLSLPASILVHLHEAGSQPGRISKDGQLTFSAPARTASLDGLSETVLRLSSKSTTISEFSRTSILFNGRNLHHHRTKNVHQPAV